MLAKFISQQTHDLWTHSRRFEASMGNNHRQVNTCSTPCLEVSTTTADEPDDSRCRCPTKPRTVSRGGIPDTTQFRGFELASSAARFREPQSPHVRLTQLPSPWILCVSFVTEREGFGADGRPAFRANFVVGRDFQQLVHPVTKTPVL
jgi:hypothetical protein